MAGVAVAAAAVLALTPLVRGVWRESQRQISKTRLDEVLRLFSYTSLESKGLVPAGAAWEGQLPWMELVASRRILNSGQVDGPKPDWIYVAPPVLPGDAYPRWTSTQDEGSYILLCEDWTRMEPSTHEILVGRADGTTAMMTRAALAAALRDQGSLVQTDRK